MPDLYYLAPSPPCRAVMLAARIADVPLNLKEVNIMAGEHLTPEFIKMNPQHCIPTLDDNGFILWESRAILGYLVDQYCKEDTLYPKNPKKRALVDQRLYFDIGTLYSRLLDYFVPVLFHGEGADEAKAEKIEEALVWMDGFLEGHNWIAGDNMTIADVSLVVTVSTVEAVGMDVAKYPNVSQWLTRCKGNMLGYEPLNQVGATALGDMFKSKLKGRM